ncbi:MULTISPECIES: hypothetical protein [Gammaproteobacteria]|uniref:hypothetical protein n=1 Tax=Gammaproteobacteria TaxID=1236 RepID=UPI00262562C2|nr:MULTISPECIES: hypothetical protein [Gammaproteobacteria]
MSDFNDDILIPLSLVTGSMKETESLLLVAYSAAPTIQYKGKSFMVLKEAIAWNESEVPMSSGVEREFRELLVKELQKTLVTGQFKYTDEMIEKWAILFKGQSEALLKTKSKKVPDGLRVLVQKAISK